MFDKLREAITGQVIIDVPEHIQNVPSYVANQLKNRGIEVTEQSGLQCDRCNQWFTFHEYSNHSCERS
jgi:hypothetical protein